MIQHLHTDRIRAVRREFPRQRIDALAITAPANIRWLTGFSGSNALLLVTPRRAELYTDPRYEEQAAVEVCDATVRIVRDMSLLSALALRLAGGATTALGFEAEHMKYAAYAALRRAVRPARCVATHGIVEVRRRCKDAAEIAALRHAVRITDRVFSEILPLLRPGARETDIAAEITYRHKRHGADGDAFPPIVLAGKRTTLIHGTPSRAAMRPGDLVLMDFGCVVRGYHSDMTRTVAIGRVPRGTRDAYDAVLAAQRTAIARIAAGVKATTVDEAARTELHACGLDALFTHGLGHGVGLDIHEAPMLSARSRETLAPGDVATVEPGVYVPGRFGIRIEDVVLVHADRVEVLTASPKELITV